MVIIQIRRLSHISLHAPYTGPPMDLLSLHHGLRNCRELPGLESTRSEVLTLVPHHVPWRVASQLYGHRVYGQPALRLGPGAHRREHAWGDQASLSIPARLESAGAVPH